jgi:hypothetical protein
LTRGRTNSRVHLKTKEGKILRMYEEGQIFAGFPMAEWLRLAGADLDARNIQPWVRGGVPEQSPFFRATGLVLLIRMHYTNLRTWNWPTLSPVGDPLCEVTVEIAPNAWGYLGSLSAFDPVVGPVTVQRTGIKAQLVFSGSVGSFDVPTIILRLVEALVLFGLSQVLTDLLARHVLHRRIFKDAFMKTLTAEAIRQLYQSKRRITFAPEVSRGPTPSVATPVSPSVPSVFAIQAPPGFAVSRSSARVAPAPAASSSAYLGPAPPDDAGDQRVASRAAVTDRFATSDSEDSETFDAISNANTAANAGSTAYQSTPSQGGVRNRNSGTPSDDPRTYTSSPLSVRFPVSSATLTPSGPYGPLPTAYNFASSAQGGGLQVNPQSQGLLFQAPPALDPGAAYSGYFSPSRASGTF